MKTDHAEKEFAAKVRSYLSRSSQDLNPGTRQKLRLARQRALERMAVAAPERVRGLAAEAPGAGRTGFGGFGWMTSAKVWVAVLMLATAFALGKHYQTKQRVSQLEEIDAALLAADVPVDALLDKGFQNWLRRDARP